MVILKEVILFSNKNVNISIGWGSTKNLSKLLELSPVNRKPNDNVYHGK